MKPPDFRFEFLKNDYENNIISESSEYEQIWRPEIEYFYVEKVIYDAFKTKVFVRKNISDTTLSGENDQVKVREVYSGKNNALMKVTKKRLKFACSFDYMESYPFKKQVCFFSFALVGSDNAILIPDQLTIKSLTKVGHYEIEKWSIEKWSIENCDKCNEIKVSMLFKIDLMSIFMVTYLPAILMNMINQATNYITSNNKYDILFTVNITCMMVLASIYLSVSASLPNTYGIKPVEIFLLFNLAYPFLVILVNIFLQVLSMIILTIEYFRCLEN